MIGRNPPFVAPNAVTFSLQVVNTTVNTCFISTPVIVICKSRLSNTCSAMTKPACSCIVTRLSTGCQILGNTFNGISQCWLIVETVHNLLPSVTLDAAECYTCIFNNFASMPNTGRLPSTADAGPVTLLFNRV